MELFDFFSKIIIPALLNKVQWFDTNFAQAWFGKENPDAVQQFCHLSILYYICPRSENSEFIISQISRQLKRINTYCLEVGQWSVFAGLGH